MKRIRQSAAEEKGEGKEEKTVQHLYGSPVTHRNTSVQPTDTEGDTIQTIINSLVKNPEVIECAPLPPPLPRMEYNFCEVRPELRDSDWRPFDRETIQRILKRWPPSYETVHINGNEAKIVAQRVSSDTHLAIRLDNHPDLYHYLLWLIERSSCLVHKIRIDFSREAADFDMLSIHGLARYAPYVPLPPVTPSEPYSKLHLMVPADTYLSHVLPPPPPATTGTPWEPVRFDLWHPTHLHDTLVGKNSFTLRHRVVGSWAIQLCLASLGLPEYVDMATLQPVQSRIPLDQFRICSVQAIYHRDLEERYRGSMRDYILEHKLRGAVVPCVLEQRYLWCGVSNETADAICTTGWKAHTSESSSFGYGNYFGRNASHVVPLPTSGRKKGALLLARVLTSGAVRGRLGMFRHPEISGETDWIPQGSSVYPAYPTDCACDNPLDPYRFVIRRDANCLPLIRIDYDFA